MRRTIVGLVALLTSSGAVPVAARPLAPAAGAGASQTVNAMWIEMDGLKGTMYVVGVERFVDAGVQTSGMVAKGRCTKTKTEFWTFGECRIIGRMRDLGLSLL